MTYPHDPGGAGFPAYGSNDSRNVMNDVIVHRPVSILWVEGEVANPRLLDVEGLSFLRLSLAPQFQEFGNPLGAIACSSEVGHPNVVATVGKIG